MSIAPTDTAAWRALAAHFETLRGVTLRALFRDDPGRAARMTFEVAGLRMDFSKHLATDETLRLLLALAEERDVAGGFDAMFRGDTLNPTEGRAVLHVALRNRAGTPVLVGGTDVMPEVGACLAKMRRLVEAVRSGAHAGHTGRDGSFQIRQSIVAVRRIHPDETAVDRQAVKHSGQRPAS